MDQSELLQISVVIPTFNCAPFIASAIESVLRQTVKVGEIVVVDDGSTDETKEILTQFADSIRYVYQTNTGLSTARNRGIEEARGEVIALLDADDIWREDKIELQASLLARHPDIEVVFSDYQNFRGAAYHRPYFEGIELLSQLRVENLDGDNLRVADNDFFRKILRHHIILPSTFMARKACFERVGNFDPSLRIVQDTHLWLRMAKQCKFAFINAPLVDRRLRDGSLITDESNFIDECIVMIQGLPNQMDRLTSDEISSIRQALDHWYWQAYRMYRVRAGRFTRSYLFNRILRRDFRLRPLLFFLLSIVPDYVVGTVNTLRWRRGQRIPIASRPEN